MACLDAFIDEDLAARLTHLTTELEIFAELVSELEARVSDFVQIDRHRLSVSSIFVFAYRVVDGDELQELITHSDDGFATAELRFRGCLLAHISDTLLPQRLQNHRSPHGATNKPP